MTAPPNAVRWFEIYVRDMPRAKAFYERVFGRTFLQLSQGGGGQPEMWAFSGHPDGSGAPGALVTLDGFDGGGDSVVVYFGADDCGVEHGRAIEAGGQSIKAKTAIPPFGFIALIRDPDGNRIGIHSMT